MLLALTLASCATAPIQKPGSELFPTPSAGISISDDTKLEKLVAEFSKVTGITAIADPETRTLLQKSTTGLNRAVEVPAAEVYSFVESVFVQNDLYLTVLHEREPRLFAIHGRGVSRASREMPFVVASNDLATFTQHPAVLITTILDLAHTDVRTLSNSMRTMFTDANTQQMIPVGNSNSLILTGLGGTVVSIAKMLQEADESAKRAEESGSRPAGTQPPAKDEKPK
jgi:type II secretory pathway component GspD/PulD (secretin)